MNTLPVALIKALVLSVAVLIAGAAVTFFAYSGGVSVNTEAWPPTAKAILAERPGQPISSDQWRRIEHELQTHGGNAAPTHLLAGEVRQTWPAYVALPLFALLLLRRLRPLSPITAGLIVVAPSLLLVLAAFLHTHPYYR
jgi:hypothetical protein